MREITLRHARRCPVAAGLLVGFCLTPVALAAGLNDSGQTLCYDGTNMVACTADNTGDAATFPRQDARYGRDAAATAGALTKIGGGAAGFDFTALDAAGQPTTPSAGATPHPCVRDNVTDLTWEVKVNDSSQLRHQGHAYTWYSTDGSTNGGDVGDVGSTTSCISTLTSCNTQAYTAAVNGTALCGFTDWRLPSIRELQTLVHYGAQNPAIDPTYFPNTLASNFWSASSYGPNPASAWVVFFDDGRVVTSGKPVDRRVRLVRGGQF